MHRTRHKHGRRSYLSDGIGGDSQRLLEREHLRSKDRGLLSYNIEDIGPNLFKFAHQHCLMELVIMQLVI